MDMKHAILRGLRLAGSLSLAGSLLACVSDGPEQSAEVQIRGSNPNATVQQTSPSGPAVASADADGIVTYDGYQTVRARGGDTVTTIAARIGMSATQLGAYNGLSPDHGLREGDELALPPRPGGYGPGGQQTTVTDAATDLAPPAAPSAPPPAADGTLPLGQTPAATGGVPVGEDGNAVAASGTADGGVWSPELAEAAIARSSGIEQDGTLGRPPSAGAPVPPEPTARPQLDSPDLGQYQTGQSDGAALPAPPQPAPETQVAAVEPQVPGLRLRRPVEGPVALGFNKGAGPARNDGVDFAAPAGATVVAAADGEVALVSESLGGLGTIVLVRHPNELLTVYGRIDGVTVSKGDIVNAGQQIGVVSSATAPAEPRMHFEVRRGAESLDPMQFF